MRRGARADAEERQDVLETEFEPGSGGEAAALQIESVMATAEPARGVSMEQTRSSNHVDIVEMLSVDVKFLDDASTGGGTRKLTMRERFRECASFIGPGFLVCVAYIDPGNLESDLQAGSKYGYQLLWVLLYSTIMGIILQYLCVKLAIVSNKDLSKSCRDEYPMHVRIPLWLLTELAIVASDIPEVIGTAFALNLLFGLPLWAGVLITGLDTLLFLAIQNYGIRYLEGFIGGLVGIIGIAFVVQMFLAGVDAGSLFVGLALPRIESMGALYLAISLLGAVVMPHNLYLHSALALTRKLPGKDPKTVKKAMFYNLIECAFTIGLSLIINVAVVSVAASQFYTIKDPEVRKEVQEHPLQYGPELLQGLLGKAAEVLFAISLLASGQSSTMTGTYAGQFVMEGFLEIKISPALRNLATRSVAIIPALITSLVAGQSGSESLIVFSSVVLAFQLPFAVIPLMKLTNTEAVMGKYANGKWMKYGAGAITAMVVAANITLLVILAATAGVVTSSFAGVLAGLVITLIACAYCVRYTPPHKDDLPKDILTDYRTYARVCVICSCVVVPVSTALILTMTSYARAMPHTYTHTHTKHYHLFSTHSHRAHSCGCSCAQCHRLPAPERWAPIPRAMGCCPIPSSRAIRRIRRDRLKECSLIHVYICTSACCFSLSHSALSLPACPSSLFGLFRNILRFDATANDNVVDDAV